MDAQSPPARFDELCFKIGLAVIQGQKVQFSLAYYFGVYQFKNANWTKEEAKASIDFHLSKPMGVVLDEIKKKTTIDPLILKRAESFRNERNWLAHDFDQESSSSIRVGQRIPEYIDRMDFIIEESIAVMQSFDQLGEQLCPLKLA
jgi:hypothetical protein